MSTVPPSRVAVGCCGFGGSMAKYFDSFEIVEIQHTFYEPPASKTLERWRNMAPEKFEFAIKAWQLITHDAKSPTYRRLKTELSATEMEKIGSFKWTAPVRRAWNRTLECAELLDAKHILLQCPASFKPTERNLDRLRRFLSEVDRNEKQIYWEPRGKEWAPDLVQLICKQFKVFHAVDPFVSTSQTPANLYFRLHGKNGWRYRYSDSDLQNLIQVMGNAKFKQAKVFFNNISMSQDASSFLELLSAIESQRCRS